MRLLGNKQDLAGGFIKERIQKAHEKLKQAAKEPASRIYLNPHQVALYTSSSMTQFRCVDTPSTVQKILLHFLRSITWLNFFWSLWLRAPGSCSSDQTASTLGGFWDFRVCGGFQNMIEG